MPLDGLSPDVVEFSSKWARTLWRAADIIAERGLGRWEFGRRGQSRCLVGAIMEATGRFSMLRPSFWESIGFAGAELAKVDSANLTGANLANLVDLTGTQQIGILAVWSDLTSPWNVVDLLRRASVRAEAAALQRISA